MNIKRLAYHYAQIDLGTYECVACFTCSYEINHVEFVAVPSYRSSYVGTYYNPADGLFYFEPEYITVFDPEA